LSGLVNRRGFEKYLKPAIESSQNDQAGRVFYYLDLDQLMIIIDTCGHIAGDELLRQISRLLKKHLRSRDVLARLGSDEFGILMQHCDIDNAQQISQKLIDHVGRHQFIWENRPFSVAVRIGILPITDAIKNSTDLLRIADIACYAAKDAGRNCFKVYQEDVLDIAKVHGDMEWVTHINQALGANSFCLFGQKIQPNVGTGNNGLHYEVLLRLIDQLRKIITPNAFLPPAERHKLITKIDMWVIENHLADLAYLAEHLKHLRALELCSINLSETSLTAPGFQQMVLGRIDLIK
jgi:diguanylate cyclase (GGDEF)-like protein